MDQVLVLLDARVAEAAEAWLTDPRDVGVYARLVAAVQDRRRHLSPPDDVPSGPDHVPTGVDGDTDLRSEASPGQEADDDADGLASDRTSAVRAVGEALAGDPRDALARLRRGGAIP